MTIKCWYAFKHQTNQLNYWNEMDKMVLMTVIDLNLRKLYIEIPDKENPKE